MAAASYDARNDLYGTSNSHDPNESQRDASPTPGQAEKMEEDQQQQDGSPEQQQRQDGPEGGFDSTPIPTSPSETIGYTLRFTMLRATNLSMGDAHALSSDPYILAQLSTDVPTRHREDPNMRFRTSTVRKSTDPEWNEEWVVANVPSTGFKLKLRVYDEDPADHDDQLGKVHITVHSINDNWTGFKDQQHKLHVRDSSKRALMIRGLATCFRVVQHWRGEVFISIENLGRTGADGQNGRMYTVGPCKWIRHHSPLLGRIAKIKEPDGNNPANAEDPSCPVQKQVERYNFQANQMQLQGPVPTQLYHRFVEFKPWVRRMFNTSGLSGVVLGKALHHQHTRVYNFGRSTIHGYFPQGPCADMTKKFLDLVHYDAGGRIFTYVLTLDALFRFTETGKEFGIDMLSKHTMHSDVSIYIAFSGEFFIRRLKHRHRPPPPQPTEGTSQQPGPDRQDNESHPAHDLKGGPPDDDPPTDPSYYELVIDNDSGTYRPNAAMLPVLAGYLSECFPGLHIQVLDCQDDAEKMAKMKGEQRERKKTEGDQVIYAQVSDSSSISSSEDERLDEVQAEYQNNGTPQRNGPNQRSRRKKASGTLQAVLCKRWQKMRSWSTKRGWIRCREMLGENGGKTEKLWLSWARG